MRHTLPDSSVTFRRTHDTTQYSDRRQGALWLNEAPSSPNDPSIDQPAAARNTRRLQLADQNEWLRKALQQDQEIA
jgi:hypothetical protein